MKRSLFEKLFWREARWQLDVSRANFWPECAVEALLCSVKCGLFSGLAAGHFESPSISANFDSLESLNISSTRENKNAAQNEVI